MAKIERAAKALIRRESDGRYLVLTCSLWPENPRRSQKPDLPGGVVEPHEQIEEGLLRELFEETGLRIRVESLQLGHCSTYYADGVSHHFMVYLTDVSGDESIKLSWEHEAYQWLTVEEIQSLEIRQPYHVIFQHMIDVGLLH